MTAAELYWVSKTVVWDWTLLELDGTPATGATIAATITLPDATTAPGTVTELPDGLYRITYDPTMAGLHAYKHRAVGAADSAAEGTFYVKPSPAAAVAYTLDPTTSIGMVRLLATDVDEDNVVFTDAQISGFLTLEGSNVRLAAAQALDTIASSEALVSKKIRTQDLATDGPAVAAELRARAAALREQAADGLGSDDGGFDIVDYTGWTWTELSEPEWS